MLDYYIESLTSGMQPFFSIYSANAIASSFLEYCNSEMFLRSHKDMSLIADSSIYIEYIRTKEGFAEAYAAFIWPECICPDPKEYVQAIPDAMTFVCLVNDILSYYKEAKTGETGGHILSYAKVHNVTEIEALHALIDQTVTIVNRIRSLVGNGKAREAWECFLAGYTQFHLCTERYQLKEIVPEYC
ncbi:isoprenoid synthase domain-containing protein [Abortiporus biennis]|nr:isoprenoid synthase domain-containing protein [Abortiporus biennis]